MLCNIRGLERRLYHLRERIQAGVGEYKLRFGADDLHSAEIYAIQELKLENKSMEKEYREYKRQLNELSEELNISISCYKELMLEKVICGLGFGKALSVRIGRLEEKPYCEVPNYRFGYIKTQNYFVNNFLNINYHKISIKLT